MTDRAARGSLFGVLLSGPNGVGELAVRSSCASHDLVVRARAVRSAPKLTSALVFSLTLHAAAGKSAVGLLSYLACAVQRLPVVYIPRGGDWVTAATESRGDGDAFFLLTLLKQNAGECSTAALVVTI